MAAATRLASEIGIKPACEALSLSRAGFYRAKATGRVGQSRQKKHHPRSLTPKEQESVLALLHAERFVDQAPPAVYATLLDEGAYLCSIRTMYRLLGKNKEIKERRRQLRHPKYSRPELLATGPNQLWTWDITKLSGPVQRQFNEIKSTCLASIGSWRDKDPQPSVYKQ